MMGGKKPDNQKGPPINASSKAEEDFVQYVPNLYTRNNTREWLRRGSNYG